MIELAVVGSDQPALVDDNFANLVGYRWRLDKDGYVMRRAKGQRIYLHHVVMPGNKYPAFLRDHISRDKMDNRLSNLRWLTPSESAQNKGPHKRNPTGTRGVTVFGNKFRAVARLDGKVHHLGYFDSTGDASSVVTAWRQAHMPFAA